MQPLCAFLLLLLVGFPDTSAVYPVPGSYYSVLLRYNLGKNRKVARLGPSPERLWAYFNPPAVLGSLNERDLENNRILRSVPLRTMNTANENKINTEPKNGLKENNSTIVSVKNNGGFALGSIVPYTDATVSPEFIMTSMENTTPLYINGRTETTRTGGKREDEVLRQAVRKIVKDLNNPEQKQITRRYVPSARNEHGSAPQTVSNGHHIHQEATGKKDIPEMYKPENEPNFVDTLVALALTQQLLGSTEQPDEPVGITPSEEPHQNELDGEQTLAPLIDLSEDIIRGHLISTENDLSSITSDKYTVPVTVDEGTAAIDSEKESLPEAQEPLGTSAGDSSGTVEHIKYALALTTGENNNIINKSLIDISRNEELMMFTTDYKGSGEQTTGQEYMDMEPTFTEHSTEGCRENHVLSLDVLKHRTSYTSSVIIRSPTPSTLSENNSTCFWTVTVPDRCERGLLAFEIQDSRRDEEQNLGETSATFCEDHFLEVRFTKNQHYRRLCGYQKKARGYKVFQHPRSVALQMRMTSKSPNSQDHWNFLIQIKLYCWKVASNKRHNSKKEPTRYLHVS